MASHPSVEKAGYRRVGWFERAGEAAGRLLGPGRLRHALRTVYRRMLLLGSGGDGIRCALPEGESVRVLPAYRFIGWNALECAAFKAAVGLGSVAFDVGANVGAYALLLGKWTGPAGKVFAFEPAPETFSALSRHVAMNGLEGVVLPQQLANSERAASLDFHADKFHGTNRLLAANEAGSGHDVQRVQAVTIDAFCAEHQLQPDLIKIDIEGFELAALRGARKTIRAGGDHLAIFVELHPAIWPQIGVSREDVLAELQVQELQLEPLSNEDDPWRAEGICVRLRRSGGR